MPLRLSRALCAAAILASVSIVAAGMPSSSGQFQQDGVRTQETPNPTHLEAAAFDAARRRLVLFGGARIANNAVTDLNETWEWDGRKWHAIPATNGEPGARRGHALAYDPGEHRVLVVGGVRTRAGATSDDALDDSWIYDGKRWERGSDIPAMSGHGLVYDATNRAMLLLGYAGRESPRPQRLAVWRRTPNGWTFVDSTGPTVTGQVRAAYDTKRSVLVVPVLHGSTSRVWEWNGTSWHGVDAPGPSPRSRHALAYDERTGRVVLVGGRDNTTRNMLGDGWSWDGSTWSALPVGAGAPEPRGSASLVADAASGRLLLYGGTAPPRGMVTDLWVWSQSGWSQWHATTDASP